MFVFAETERERKFHNCIHALEQPKMDFEKKDEEGRNGSRSESPITCLHDDTMSDILKRVPADDLFRSASYTCKSWARIVNEPYFHNAQLLHGKPGIFIKRLTYPYSAQLLNIDRNGEYEVTTQFNHTFHGPFLNSSCGVHLFYNSEDLHVFNPITLEAVKLPRVLSRTLESPYCTLVCVPRTGEFKVFAADVVFNQYDKLYVLTLGKDNEWKRIDEGSGVFEFRCAPIYIEDNGLYWITRKELILMDVDTETFRQFQIPEGHQQFHSQNVKIKNRLASILYTGPRKYQIHTFDSETRIWDLIHEMKNLNYPSGGLEVRFAFFKVWMNDELIISTSLKPKFSSLIFSYNMTTGTLRKIEAVDEGLYDVGIHTNGLLSLKSSPSDPSVQ